MADARAREFVWVEVDPFVIWRVSALAAEGATAPTAVNPSAPIMSLRFIGIRTILRIRLGFSLSLEPGFLLCLTIKSHMLSYCEKIVQDVQNCLGESWLIA